MARGMTLSDSCRKLIVDMLIEKINAGNNSVEWTTKNHPDEVSAAGSPESGETHTSIIHRIDDYCFEVIIPLDITSDVEGDYINYVRFGITADDTHITLCHANVNIPTVPKDGTAHEIYYRLRFDVSGFDLLTTATGKYDKQEGE